MTQAEFDVQVRPFIEAYVQERLGIFADKRSQEALVNLTLIEDGHPTHVSNDLLRTLNKPPLDKADQVLASLGAIDAGLKKLALATTTKGKREGAQLASDAIAAVTLFLTTYAFDGARRFAVMHQSLRPIRDTGLEPKPGLQEHLDHDTKAINEELDMPVQAPEDPLRAAEWKVRAQRSWRRLLLWHEQAKL